MAISWDKGCSAYISVNHADSLNVSIAELRHTLNAILETHRVVAMRNANFDLRMLANGLDALIPDEYVHDTRLYAYLDGAPAPYSRAGKTTPTT